MQRVDQGQHMAGVIVLDDVENFERIVEASRFAGDALPHPMGHDIDLGHDEDQLPHLPGNISAETEAEVNQREVPPVLARTDEHGRCQARRRGLCSECSERLGRDRAAARPRGDLWTSGDSASGSILLTEDIEHLMPRTEHVQGKAGAVRRSYHQGREEHAQGPDSQDEICERHVETLVPRPAI